MEVELDGHGPRKGVHSMKFTIELDVVIAFWLIMILIRIALATKK